MFKSALPLSASVAVLESQDYQDTEGYLVCGKCHTRKQYEICLNGRIQRVPVLCQCEVQQRKTQEEQERQAQKQRRIQQLRQNGVTDPSYLQYTFAHDDARHPQISDVCRKYVSRWPEMYRENIGILFYGSVGAGKTFYACSIANALLDQGICVLVTSFPRLLYRLQNSHEPNSKNILDRLNGYHLLVIDDLGVERDTSYAAEQVFHVIDARARLGKPLIITTNLSLEDLKTPSTLPHARIYDRVLELCPITLKMNQASRRAELAMHKQQIARQLLREADGK